MWGPIFKMPIFGIELEKDLNLPLAKLFLKDSHNRLQSDSIVKSPFTGFIHTFENIAIIEMEPIFVKVYWFAIIPLALSIGLGWRWPLIPTAIFSSMYFFWSKRFYYIMLKKGIRRVGYKGEIKLFNTDECIRRLYNGTNGNTKVLRTTKDKEN